MQPERRWGKTLARVYSAQQNQTGIITIKKSSDPSLAQVGYLKRVGHYNSPTSLPAMFQPSRLQTLGWPPAQGTTLGSGGSTSHQKKSSRFCYPGRHNRRT